MCRAMKIFERRTPYEIVVLLSLFTTYFLKLTNRMLGKLIFASVKRWHRRNLRLLAMSSFDLALCKMALFRIWLRTLALSFILEETVLGYLLVSAFIKISRITSGSPKSVSQLSSWVSLDWAPLMAVEMVASNTITSVLSTLPLISVAITLGFF